jgi:hypothetical protein
MRIDKPEVIETNGEIYVLAQVKIRASDRTFPNTVWFRFPKSYNEYVTDRADCFATLLLPLAMRYGEDLEIGGALSPRLANGMQQYQRIQQIWKPNEFKLIKITCPNLKPTNPFKTAEGVGCAFSGGVDSFYTLWAHLPQQEPNPGYRISHCLMINGFDLNSMPENTEHFFNKTRQLYEPMMNKLGLHLLVAHTNIWQFMDKREWKNYMYTFGSVLVACALALGQLFSRFYIASSFQYAQLFPWGSHPLLDHLLCTESMESIHDGAHLTRVEKIAALSRWPETYSRLRTCLFNTFFIDKAVKLENCCRCERCVQTMSVLDMLRVLDKYTVFPKPLKSKSIRKINFFNIPEKRKYKYIYAREIIDYARNIGRRDVAFNFRYAIFRNIFIKDQIYRVKHAIKKILQYSFKQG